MENAEMLAWQALTDLIRLIMLTGFLGFAYIVWRIIKSESSR